MGIEPSVDDVRDNNYDEQPIEEAYVRFIFSLEKNETKVIFDSIDKFFQYKSKDDLIVTYSGHEYSLEQFCHNRKEVLYSIDLIERKKAFRYWSISKHKYQITGDWRKVDSNWVGFSDFDNAEIMYINLDDYPEYKLDTKLEKMTINDLNTIVGTELVAFLEENIFPCVVWKYSENNLLPERVDLASFKADEDYCEPLRNMFYLAGYNDIAESILTAEKKTNGLKNMLQNISKKTSQHLHTVWPEYKNILIEITVNGSVLEMGVQDEHNFYSMERRSDGFKRFITFLLMISVNVKYDILKDTLIIMDEPDTGLHPSGITFLRKELEKIAKKNLVVAATHSIFMIDKERVDRHLIVTKKNEKTSIQQGMNSKILDEEVIYKALGFSIFDLLKQRNVIFEGWYDKHTFRVWLNSKYSKKHKALWSEIGLIHSIGARDIGRVATDLDNMSREYIVISDSDKPSLEAKNKFVHENKWYTFTDLGFDDKETIEDFVDEAHVVNSFKYIIGREQLNVAVPDMDGSTFNQKMKRFSKDLESELAKDDIKRLEKLVKDRLFDKVTGKQIKLTDLVNKIDIESKF